MFNDPYNANGVPQYYGNPMQNRQSQTPQTNKILVMNLQDALSRPAPNNSIVMYIDQETGHLYEVSIDMSGRKTWREFETSECQQKDSYNKSIEDRLKAIEDKLATLTKEEPKNEHVSQ